MNKIKVIIADDHQLVIDGIKSLLSDAKEIEVVGEAHNGKQAVEIAQKEEIDVILMDIDMPVINGCDATRIITNSCSGCKIIALTMFNDKTLISEMMSAGVKGYILKNTGKNELVKAIIKVYEGQIYYSSEIPITLLKPYVENILLNKEQIDSPILKLSEREIQVLTLIAQGMTNTEISKQLFISCRTVDTHRNNLMHKLNIHNVAGLIKYAISNGLI